MRFGHMTPRFWMDELRFWEAPGSREKGSAAAVARRRRRNTQLLSWRTSRRRRRLFDARLQDDEGALGRARTAQSEDPLTSVRKGVIAREMLDEPERRQEQFREVLELRAAQNLSAVVAVGALVLGDLLKEWAPEVSVEDDEDLMGGGPAGGWMSWSPFRCTGGGPSQAAPPPRHGGRGTRHGRGQASGRQRRRAKEPTKHLRGRWGVGCRGEGQQGQGNKAPWLLPTSFQLATANCQGAR